MFYKRPLTFAATLALACLAASTVHGQEAAALIDALVREGVLTPQKAEKIRADVERDAVQSSANKIKLSDSVSKLKLYGDLTLFWQYNDNERQIDDGSHLNQQSRWRYRLRLNADIDLGPNWFAGLELQTGQTPDSAKQTFSNGFNNDNIYISRAYLGWHNDW